MVKISRNSMVIRRIAKLKKDVNIDTQRLRGKALKSLEELFNLATKMAKGQVKVKKGKKTKEITLKQRQIWARIAAYIAQIINSICAGFDERQINKDLDELERLVNEARAKAKNGKTQKEAASTRGN